MTAAAWLSCRLVVSSRELRPPAVMLRKTRRRMLAIGCRSSQFNRHRPVVSDQRLGHRSDLKVSNDELIVLITRGHVTERDLFLLAEPHVNAIENFKLREEVDVLVDRRSKRLNSSH